DKDQERVARRGHIAAQQANPQGAVELGRAGDLELVEFSAHERAADPQREGAGGSLRVIAVDSQEARGVHSADVYQGRVLNIPLDGAVSVQVAALEVHQRRDQGPIFEGGRTVGLRVDTRYRQPAAGADDRPTLVGEVARGSELLAIPDAQSGA